METNDVNRKMLLTGALLLVFGLLTVVLLMWQTSRNEIQEMSDTTIVAEEITSTDTMTEMSSREEIYTFTGSYYVSNREDFNTREVTYCDIFYAYDVDPVIGRKIDQYQNKIEGLEGDYFNGGSGIYLDLSQLGAEDVTKIKASAQDENGARIDESKYISITFKLREDGLTYNPNIQYPTCPVSFDIVEVL